MSDLAAERARALLRGEPEAFDHWFRAEHPVVWRLCFGFLAQDAEADDLAQEALLRLHDRLRMWDSTRDYGAWRNTLVANLCRDRLRRKDTRRAAEATAAEAGLPDRMPAPEDPAQAEDVRRVLAEALGRLSPREREVFVLRDLEGHSTGEVSASLGITQSSVRSLGTMARRRLRELLAPRLSGFTIGGEAQ